ncbi:MAG: hypothetical protein NZ601_02960 [candidate division WOR-3 bacterium]|nr:hypothetical protein [candidate division WOR-3 bacterium]MCX7756943.1 hypothetical protein [candidate division WOR-3 bacterium]MDW7987715.1 hypothetical protein [candidate division WOR-3 bacterium]
MRIKQPIIFIGIFVLLSLSYAKNSFTVAFDYEDNKPVRIVLSGILERPIYVGISLYPSEVKDPLTEGYHLVKEIKPAPKDSFRTMIALSETGTKNYNNSYEIAFWGKKILAKDCKIKDCYWCKTRGYHLDELLFYKTGYFNNIGIK